jgi:hypothetical protein
MTYAQAKAEARRLAVENTTKIYIAECEIYARGEDEYGEGPYIVGSIEVFAIMYDHLKQYGGRIVGVVDSEGNDFCNDLSIVLGELSRA